MVKKSWRYLIYLIVCLFAPNLQAKKINIDSLYHSGIQHLQDGKPQVALKIFEHITNKEYFRPEGHYGLGLVYKNMYPDSNLAVPHFENAIEMGDNFEAPAYYQLGRLYRNLGLTEEAIEALERSLRIEPANKKGWYQLDTLRQISSEPPPELALRYLPERLMHNLSNDTLGTLYLRAALWHSKQNEALEELNKLYQQGYYPTWLLLALVELNLHTEQYSDGLALLDTHAIHLQQRARFEQLLFRVKILFQMNKDTMGLAYYERALQAIDSKENAQTMYGDLYYLFTQEDYQMYKDLPGEQAAEFYRRFWIARDPDHSTELNERIPEHYRRLATAYRDYRRYAGKSFNNEILYRFEHPYRFFGPEMGDEFVASLNPNGLPQLRAIDDLGIIYIRHGEPDNKIFTLCSTCNQNLSIEYYRRGDRPRLIFHFIKHSGWRNWMLETIPSYFAGRDELGYIYVHFSENPFYYLPALSEENERLARIGYTTETSAHVFPEEPFIVPIALLGFKGTAGKSLIDLYYGLNGQYLELREDTLYLSKFVALYDSTWHEIVKIDSRQIEIPMGKHINTWEAITLVDKNTFVIQPGNYHYEFQIVDKIAGKRCVYQNSYRVKNYYLDTLMLSDILLSGVVEVSEWPTKFRKGDLVYRPHMFTHYPPNSVLGVYFEIYNLFLNADDQSDFELTWKFKQLEKSGNFISRLFKRKSPGLSSTVMYNGRTRDDRIYINIDLSGQPLGKYEIALTISDKLSGESAGDTLEIFIK